MTDIQYDPENHNLYIARVRTQNHWGAPNQTIAVFDAVKDPLADEHAQSAIGAWLAENWEPHSVKWNGGQWVAVDGKIGGWVAAIVDHQENTPASRERDRQREEARKAEEADRQRKRLEWTGLRFTVKPGLEDDYNTMRVANSTGMNRAITELARYWGGLMERDMIGLTERADIQAFIDNHALDYSHRADIDDVTGSMYAKAVLILVTYWIHGDALKRWHNRYWGGTGDEDGVADNSLLNIGGPS